MGLSSLHFLSSRLINIHPPQSRVRRQIHHKRGLLKHFLELQCYASYAAMKSGDRAAKRWLCNCKASIHLYNVLLVLIQDQIVDVRKMASSWKSGVLNKTEEGGEVKKKERENISSSNSFALIWIPSEMSAEVGQWDLESLCLFFPPIFILFFYSLVNGKWAAQIGEGKMMSWRVRGKQQK